MIFFGKKICLSQKEQWLPRAWNHEGGRTEKTGAGTWEFTEHLLQRVVRSCIHMPKLIKKNYKRDPSGSNLNIDKKKTCEL